MTGTAVRLSDIPHFLQQGIDKLHSSAGRLVDSAIRYRNPGLSMSPGATADQFTRYCADGDTVIAMKAYCIPVFHWSEKSAYRTSCRPI